MLKDKAEIIEFFCYKSSRLLLIVLLVLQVACGTKQMPDNFGLLPVTGVNLSDEIVLLDMATEKVMSCMTNDGWVHLVAITAKGEAYHVAVSDQKIERRETLGGNERYGYYNNLAIADDGLGRLNVVIKDKHLILDHGNWLHAGSNLCSLLALSGDSLACILDVEGNELGTKAQWGITDFGGGPAGIIIPYRIRPSKLVLGSFGEEGWSYNAVINHSSPYFVNLESYDDAIMVSASHGIIYILYRAHGDSGVHVRYAAVSLARKGTQTIEWRRSDTSVVELTELESFPINIPQDWFVPFGGLTFAVDPLTGKGVFFARHSVGGFGSWSDGIVEIREGFFSQPTLLPFKDSKPQKIAPAGQERFHVLVAFNKSLLYMSYHAKEWSGPTRIGEFGTPSLFLIDSSSIQLASNGKNRALAIWPKREGRLVGRWIKLDDMPH